MSWNRITADEKVYMKIFQVRIFSGAGCILVAGVSAILSSYQDFEKVVVFLLLAIMLLSFASFIWPLRRFPW